MSSDDSGFDKEAEREKLREKYEADQQDRENTQRMSELLLQGATMTGKHCNECGDPIFRYDGQEFCPTCQHEVESQAQQADADQSAESAESPQATGDASEADDTATDRPAADQSAAATDSATHSDDEPRVEINDVRVADQHADRSNVRRPPSQTEGGRRNRGSPDDSRRSPDRASASRGRNRDEQSHHRIRDDAHRHADESPETATRVRRETRSPDAGDLATARESLVRKLTDLALEAEETDDVGRSRELLAATREAAEAVAALDRANR